MVANPNSPVNYQFAATGPVSTAYGGAGLWLEALWRSGALRALPRGVSGGQGWTDGQMLLSIVLLNVLGFDCAEDLERMEADPGLCGMVRRYEPRILGVGRKWLARRQRGGRRRTLPSPRALLDWLHGHQDAEAGQERRKGEAIVPRPAASLAVFWETSRRLFSQLVDRHGLRRITLDLDATIVASGKREALPTYRASTGVCPGETGYQPLNVFCAELGLMVHSEMRDGNVPAREGNARVLLEALERLPGAVEEVTVRSDSAGHAAEVIRLCNRPETRPEAGSARRLGVVGFVISAVHSEALMNQVMRTPETAWKPLGEKPKEPEAEVASIAEINFVSNADGHRKGPEILRYIAVRRPRPGSLGVKANEIPARDGHPAYGIRALLTNIPAPGSERPDGLGPKPMPAEEVLSFANRRCGDAEQVHDTLKNSLAGGILPCGRFGSNAAWWHGAILALNVHVWLGHSALEADLRRAHWKRLRAVILVHAARLVWHARRWILVLRQAGTEELRAALERLSRCSAPG